MPNSDTGGPSTTPCYCLGALYLTLAVTVTKSAETTVYKFFAKAITITGCTEEKCKKWQNDIEMTAEQSAGDGTSVYHVDYKKCFDCGVCEPAGDPPDLPGGLDEAFDQCEYEKGITIAGGTQICNSLQTGSTQDPSPCGDFAAIIEDIGEYVALCGDYTGFWGNHKPVPPWLAGDRFVDPKYRICWMHPDYKNARWKDILRKAVEEFLDAEMPQVQIKGCSDVRPACKKSEEGRSSENKYNTFGLTVNLGNNFLFNGKKT